MSVSSGTHFQPRTRNRFRATTDIKDSDRYKSNLQGEVDSAALYRTLAETEENPDIAQVYRRLAAVEESHAEFWRKKLRELHQKIPASRSAFARALSAGWRGAGQITARRDHDRRRSLQTV